MDPKQFIELAVEASDATAILAVSATRDGKPHFSALLGSIAVRTIGLAT